jgi:signal transduction histidine kinase/ActR/RegA family two-component response regulator
MAHESILVADDEPDVLDLCRTILTAEGYQVEAARTGYQVLERVKQKSFDLVLIDIKMPGMNGLEIAQAVKEIDPSIICVTMTGYSTMDTAIEALKLGVEEFLLKPFGQAELCMSIAKALEKERLHKENIRLQSLIPLFEFNKTLLSTVEVDTLLSHVLDLAQKETQAELAILVLSRAGEIREYAHPAMSESDGQVRLLRLELTDWIMQHQQQLALRRGESVLPRFENLLETLDMGYLVALPLIAIEGQSLGALMLGKRSEPFASGDSEFLQVMLGQAAIAIENARLFQEIQQAYDELKKLDHLKSEFINIAAHELRTPLAILIGYVSVMNQEANELDRARLDIISRNAAHLGTLLDEMLNLSYLETGRVRLNIEQISLTDVIQQIVFDMQELARQKSLHVEANIPDDLPPLMADREKLELMILNLLSNAIKYTPEGGYIWCRAWLEGDKAFVSVRDTGIGIPPEEHDRIFDRFYQVEDSLTRQYGGIGLGLAIVKRLVELCQGKIWIESEVGQGSTFTLELPLQLSPQIS